MKNIEKKEQRNEGAKIQRCEDTKERRNKGTKKQMNEEMS
jgi:hypothetical protein